MPALPREVELNTAAASPAEARELREFLISASNELYLFEVRCRECRRPVPESLRRAHAAVRAEMRRLALEAEER